MNRKAKKIIRRHFTSTIFRELCTSLFLIILEIGLFTTSFIGQLHGDKDYTIFMIAVGITLILVLTTAIDEYKTYRRALKACEPYLYLADYTKDELAQHLATVKVEVESIKKTIADEKAKYEQAIAEPKRIYEEAIRPHREAYREVVAPLNNLLEQENFNTVIDFAETILETYQKKGE